MTIEDTLSPITSGTLEPLDPAETGWAWVIIGEHRLGSGDAVGALDALRCYRTAPQLIESQLFKARAREIERRASEKLSVDGLFFSRREDIQSFASYEEQIQRWLLQRVEGKSRDEQATSIGVRPATITAWKRKFGMPTRSKARAADKNKRSRKATN